MRALTAAELRVGELTVGERLAPGMVEDPLSPQSSDRTDPVSSFPCSHPTAPPPPPSAVRRRSSEELTCSLD